MKSNDSANKHSRDVQKILFHLSRKKERARERVAELQCTDSVTRLGNFVTIWAKFQTPCANIFEKRAQINWKMHFCEMFFLAHKALR